ncbi:beta-phosphoglucomutase [Paenibacillus polymyxa]|uniref:beta-phosphoglucomutase n=1 Tax=Paenibacillus polymyxa TaxID=1406 RepID=UPI002AB375C0|nr:beta-phosphoglucomutase [Paenibacillus polymyxa]MDY8025489.1 beta-phosphoglucomutase [Paenibacillus polymyxa]
MKYKAIIFDLDGVICFTDDYHYQAWKKVADSLEINFDEAVNNRLRGVSRMESLNIILENHPRKLKEEEKLAIAEEKNAYYKTLLTEMSPADLRDEVRETLLQLREQGLKLAIGSSSQNARYILERIGLGDFFDAVSDGSNITNSKPDPEVFIKAAQYIGVYEKDCLVVEDAIAGIKAAVNAKMDSAAIGDAAQYDLASYHMNSFRELLQICK